MWLLDEEDGWQLDCRPFFFARRFPDFKRL
jgi:hypothetical protein